MMARTTTAFLVITAAAIGGSALGAPIEPTYASLLENIFRPKCLACHDVGSRTGVVLATYDDLISSQVVAPGEPERSPLFRSVVRQQPGVEPRMPKRSRLSSPSYLGAEETKAIADWIRAGAPPDRQEEK